MKNGKRLISEQLLTAGGTLLLAIGIQLFLTPNKLSTGGVTSIGTVLLYLYRIRLSVTNLVINAVLFLVGWRYLGKSAVIKTLSGIVFLSLFLELTRGFPAYTGNLLVAAITGGVLMGLGIGLVIRAGASTGGSDFLSLVLKHFYPHISLSTMILMTDSLIIGLTGILFRSFEITFYSLLSLYVSYKLTDKILIFGSHAKSIHIFSSKNEEIAEIIMSKFERGVSGLYGQGMYAREEGYMLFCVVSPKEVPRVLEEVRRIDRHAFVVVEEATEVWGEGFPQRGL